MKHQVLSISLFAIVSTALVAGCGKQSDAEIIAELKPILAASCKENATKSNSHMTPEAIGKYCDCSAEKAVTMLGATRIRAITGGESMSPIDQQALQEAGSTCAVDMLKNMLTENAAPKPQNAAPKPEKTAPKP
jgi:fumarylacetoacetate (FAA) hydrolase family protein